MAGNQEELEVCQMYLFLSKRKKSREPDEVVRSTKQESVVVVLEGRE